MAKGETTQTTKVELPPEARQLLDLSMPYLTSFAKTPPQAYPGSAVAPFDPLQVAGQEGALSAAGGPQAGIVGSAGTAQQRLTSGELLTPASNPALRDTIAAGTRPIIEDLLFKALPAIRGEASTTGNFGSSRQALAEGLATGKAAQAVGDTGAKIASTGYLAGLDALTKGVGLAPQTANAQLIPALTTSGVGDVRQAMTQALLGEDVSKFNYNQLLPLLVGQKLASIAAGIPGGSVTTTASGPQSNPIMSGLGLASTGLGLLGDIGSFLPGLGSLGTTLGGLFGGTAAAGGAEGIGALLPLLAL